MYSQNRYAIHVIHHDPSLNPSTVCEVLQMLNLSRRRHRLSYVVPQAKGSIPVSAVGTKELTPTYLELYVPVHMHKPVYVALRLVVAVLIQQPCEFIFRTIEALSGQL